MSARAHAGRKVVLLLPPYEGDPLGPPAGLLALSSTLLASGFEAKIIDAAVDADWLQAVERETADAVCLGISLLTGPMIGGAIAAAQRVKAIRPELPVVFGGWHPTLLPEQTLREAFVDVVVRHQGEITFPEVVRRLADGASLEGVAGCWYKAEGEVRSNPDRAMPAIQDLPTPAYELVDFDAYERSGGGRKLPYATSVGCPYTCRYCTDTVFYNRRFNAYEAERAAAELCDLVALHRIEEVALLDSNFLVNVKRATAIAGAIVDRGVRFHWTFQASTDLLCRMSDAEVRLLAEAGVHHIGFGTESASEKVLRAMSKKHQSVDDMFEAARKCKQAGIRTTFNLIFGYPGETDADRDETLRVMGAIAEQYDNVTFSPNIFTPYPGIPVWDELRKLGVVEPDSLDGWRTLALGANMLPWMRGEPLRKLNRKLAWFLLANELSKRLRRARSGAERAVFSALRRPVSWRLKRQIYGLPLELWLCRPAMRRSLLTGEALPSEVC